MRGEGGKRVSCTERPKGNATENVAKIEKRNFDFALGVRVYVCVCDTVVVFGFSSAQLQHPRIHPAQTELLIELNFLAASLKKRIIKKIKKL